MDIQDLIKLQNRAYVFAINRKLGNVLPMALITKQLAAGKDAHAIAQLIVKTKNKLEKEEDEAKNPGVESKAPSSFEKFVNWIRRFKS
jgi:hypothetical protein